MPTTMRQTVGGQRELFTGTAREMEENLAFYLGETSSQLIWTEVWDPKVGSHRPLESLDQTGQKWITLSFEVRG